MGPTFSRDWDRARLRPPTWPEMPCRAGEIPVRIRAPCCRAPLWPASFEVVHAALCLSRREKASADQWVRPFGLDPHAGARCSEPYDGNARAWPPDAGRHRAQPGKFMGPVSARSAPALVHTTLAQNPCLCIARVGRSAVRAIWLAGAVSTDQPPLRTDCGSCPGSAATARIQTDRVRQYTLVRSAMIQAVSPARSAAQPQSNPGLFLTWRAARDRKNSRKERACHGRVVTRCDAGSRDAQSSGTGCRQARSAFSELHRIGQRVHPCSRWQAGVRVGLHPFQPGLRRRSWLAVACCSGQGKRASRLRPTGTRSARSSRAAEKPN